MDADVVAALRLGWHMSQAFHNAPPWGHSRPELSHLPSLSELSAAERGRILNGQIASDIELLKLELPGRLPLPDSEASNRENARRTLAEVFAAMHAEMAARNNRLEVALGLGRMLSDTVLLPNPQDPEQLNASFAYERLQNAYGWLGDLSAVLPQHAADVVSGSLATWEHWVSKNSSTASTSDRVYRALRAQGKLWRQLLFGDKSAEGQLSADDYALAAARLTGKFGRALWGYLLRWVPILILIVSVSLFLALLIVQSQASFDAKLLGYVATALGLAGITWKTVGSSFGKALASLAEPLWVAEEKEAMIVACSRHLPTTTRKIRSSARRRAVR